MPFLCSITTGIRTVEREVFTVPGQDLGNSGYIVKVNHDFTEQLLFKIKQGQGHHK